jgi:hypothetical protein
MGKYDVREEIDEKILWDLQVFKPPQIMKKWFLLCVYVCACVCVVIWICGWAPRWRLNGWWILFIFCIQQFIHLRSVPSESELTSSKKYGPF